MPEMSSVNDLEDRGHRLLVRIVAIRTMLREEQRLTLTVSDPFQIDKYKQS